MQLPICWICGRTSDEIRSLLDGETEAEIDLKDKIKKTEQLKFTFVDSSGKWTQNIPSQFEELDLQFILQNPNQFKSIKFLSELRQSAESVINDLEEMSYRGRRGDYIYLGDVPTDKTNDERRNIIQKLDEFEKKTKRSLRRKDTYDHGDSVFGSKGPLEGLKFREGIDFLTQAALFKFDLELQLLSSAKEDAKKSRPNWSVGAVKLKGYPKELALCNVCEELLKQLHPVDYDYWDDE